MGTVTFIGAGSSIFVKNIIGDCMLTPSLSDFCFRLMDIDEYRLAQSKKLLDTLNESLGSKARIEAYTDRREALKGANYVINAIAVGEYDPYIKSDFEIPMKYGLEQTVADTLGVGGLFRALRTAPVVLDTVRDMEELCPDAWYFNYTNPMAIITGAIQRSSGIRSVGLCHSVQDCAKELLGELDMPADNLIWRIGGINHQAWMLELTRNGEDLYPEIRRRAAAREDSHNNMVRYELMRLFGYYLTESSSHGSEYLPYYHKKCAPELKQRYNIPTDGYKNWANGKAQYWKEVGDLIENRNLTHIRSKEYLSYILEAIETDTPYEIAGNVLNTGRLIPNLPDNACVEVPCMVNGSGVLPIYFGALPEQCAALNRTNVNMQIMAVEAALSGRREHVYHSALLDPHTSAELTTDEIIKMCDEMLDFNRQYINYK